jgi:hypothetical protein
MQPMKNILVNLKSPAIISFILLIPLMVMEVVNRRNFNEGFPFILFFVLWLNLFAISLILLPIVRAIRAGNQDMATPVLAQGNSLLANPKSAAMISLALILTLGILPLLDSLGWLSSDRLFNGPNPEVAYLPGQVMSLGLLVPGSRRDHCRPADRQHLAGWRQPVCASDQSDYRRRNFVPLHSRRCQLDRGPMALFYGCSELRLIKNRQFTARG